MIDEKTRPNQLIYEKSPYLLQHAYNPVNWHAWNKDTFAKAKEEDKPIFLSIGYATCHWCHVMEHESFEDREVAKALNSGFIPIKVDREERPDIDGLYMTVCQMMTGRGGWPLTIFMSPEKKPFFAATYIPKHGRFGHSGLVDILAEVSRMWTHERDKITDSADKISRHLQTVTRESAGASLDTRVLDTCLDNLKQRFDPQYGGFGEAPKFPSPHNFLFLLRSWRRTRDAKSLEMVESTLMAMRRGGVFDQLGFGFHRYSTDKYWLVPHFEKMLYDQALMILVLSETFLVTQNPIYAEIIKETATYVLSDMTSADGGFFSAEDADSEGEEGKFYMWTEQEIDAVLTSEEAGLAKQVFGTKRDGNYKDEASGQKTGANILYLPRSLEKAARDTDLEIKELKSRLETVRQKLLAARNERPRPLLDDKVLTDWNGLMIAALAYAGRALNNENFIQAAQRAAGFILETMYKDDRLLHRYRDGQAAINGMLDDYSFFCFGLLHLFQATQDPEYLDKAKSLTQSSLRHFWDQTNGGLFNSADDAEELLVRQKDITDGAIPSGNSVAMDNLLTLSLLTGDAGPEEKADQLAKAFSGLVDKVPTACTYFLSALDLALGSAKEVVIVSPKKDKEASDMLKALDNTYLPDTVHLLKTGNTEEQLTQLAPYTKDMTSQESRAKAYVCQGQRCQRPVTSVREMLESLIGQGN
ncbi:MAG TPA: thioredoxin domain-containing protein [Desulfohalobiaceae bacterium]|nr:thioredoxin domain-containing protein [Desulfohalobiaceae bacterium]